MHGVSQTWAEGTANSLPTGLDCREHLPEPHEAKTCHSIGRFSTEDGLLAETVSEMVLRLKDTRHFFTPHNLRARKTIPALLSLYVLIDGYDDSELLAEQPPVSGSRVQELIFGVLAMYIVSLGDRVTVRGQKEPGGALADEELGLATILDAFLSASDGKSRYT